MRWLVVLALLTVSARCQQQQLLIFSSDMFGHYVPFYNATDECPLDPKQPGSPVLQTLQLENEDELSLQDSEEDLMAEDVTSRWGDCGSGGIPRLAGWVNAIRNEGPVVTAGNILGDGAWELAVDFNAAVLAASKFDVMGLGPGEFLRGPSFLKEFLKSVNDTANTSIVACNVNLSLPEGVVRHWVDKNGIRFVGVVDPAAVADYVSFDADIQLSSVSCVQEEINKMENKSVPVVVIGAVASLNSSILNVTGVTAFVLSGLPEEDKKEVLQGLRSTTENNATVLVTEGFGETVGIFDIKNPSDSYNITHLNSAVAEDSSAASDTANLQQKVTGFYDTPVVSYFDLTSEHCNSTECSIGDVICDAALIGSLLDGRVTSQPIAVWPGQNLTGKIPKGDLTVQQLYSILPSEQVAIANASGTTVIQLFARAVQDMTVDASASATFLQVSGVHVTYDLDLDRPYRAKYLMNLCLKCSPQEYLPITESSNYTIVLPVSMLNHPSWTDIVSQFTGVYITGFSARDAVATKAQVTGRLLSPVGDRIGFTHIPPDMEPTSDTFVAVLSTVVVCMVVFGLGLFGFHVWSRRQSQFGSSTGLLR